MFSNIKIQFDRFKDFISTWYEYRQGESIFVISILSLVGLTFIMTILPNIGSDNFETQVQYSNEEMYLGTKNPMSYGRCSLISSVEDDQFVVSWNNEGKFVPTRTLYVLSANCLAEYLAFLSGDPAYDIPHIFEGYQVSRDICIMKLSRITLVTHRYDVDYPLMSQCNSILRKSRGQKESISPRTGKVTFFDIDIKNIGIPIKT